MFLPLGRKRLAFRLTNSRRLTRAAASIPKKPPADMPPPTPGEDAECDSNFISDAAVGGQAKQTDATHAIVTITQVKVTLQLEIIVWVPNKVTQHVVEHEQGHRQI